MPDTTLPRRHLIAAAPGSLAALFLPATPATAESLPPGHREAIRAAALITGPSLVPDAPAPVNLKETQECCLETAAALSPVTTHLRELGEAYRAEVDRLPNPDERDHARSRIGRYLATTLARAMNVNLEDFCGECFITGLLEMDLPSS